MLRLILTLVLGLASVAWADLSDDLKACQAQTATLTMQVRDTQQARMAYVAKLAETREQLDQVRQQVQQMAQELQRLKAPKPEEKK